MPGPKSTFLTAVSSCYPLPQKHPVYLHHSPDQQDKTLFIAALFIVAKMESVFVITRLEI